MAGRGTDGPSVGGDTSHGILAPRLIQSSQNGAVTFNPLSDDQRERLARMRLTVSTERGISDDADEGEGAVTSWVVNVVERDEDWNEVGAICLLRLASCDLNREDLWYVLDAMEGDLEVIASAVLDRESGDLAEDLEESIEPFGDRLLILNSVRLAEEWRGHGLGPLLAGLAIETLAPGARLAVTYPAPMGDPIASTREEAVDKLGQVWSHLGFTQYRGGVWILDMGLVHFDKALETLRNRLGL